MYYAVTECVKTDKTWMVGAFNSAPQDGPSVILNIKAPPFRYNGGYYRYRDPILASKRLGDGQLSTEPSLEMSTTEDLLLDSAPGRRNQCVFFRGYQLADLSFKDAAERPSLWLTGSDSRDQHSTIIIPKVAGNAAAIEGPGASSMDTSQAGGTTNNSLHTSEASVYPKALQKVRK
jgi:hypothetical protein